MRFHSLNTGTARTYLLALRWVAGTDVSPSGQALSSRLERGSEEEAVLRTSYNAAGRKLD